MHNLNIDNDPPLPGPKHPLFRVKGTDAHVYTICSKSLFGIWTHWDGKQSGPCYNHGTKCQGCSKNQARRWRGYLHCFDHNLEKEGFLELTSTAARALKEMVEVADELRGIRIKVRRVGNSMHARLKIETLQTAQDLDKYPQPKDPLETLCKLWGLDLNELAGEFENGLPG